MADETLNETKDYLSPLAPHEEGVTEGAVVSVIDQAEINQQIATARRYPRMVSNFRRNLYQMVTIDTDTAASCIYAVPRDGKMIDGPSIRFAELLLVGWGNNRAAAEVTSIDEEFVVAQGTFFDLETNSAIQGKVMRRITGKPSQQFPKGKRFGPDMIAVTGNAACSIAMRNAILRGVPKALWNDIWHEAKKVAAGNAQTFATRRDRAIKDLGQQGVTPDQIYALFEIKGAEDMTTEHMLHLRGLHNAIKDGETNVDEAFGKALKPGQVAPPVPQRSDFERAEPEKTADKPADNKPAAQVKADAPAEAKAETAQAETAAPAGETEKAEEPTTANPADPMAAFNDWFADQKGEMERADSMRKLVDLRDETMPQLDGFPEMEKEFTTLYDAQMAKILNKNKNKGGKAK